MKKSEFTQLLPKTQEFINRYPDEEDPFQKAALMCVIAEQLGDKQGAQNFADIGLDLLKHGWHKPEADNV